MDLNTKRMPTETRRYSREFLLSFQNHPQVVNLKPHNLPTDLYAKNSYNKEQIIKNVREILNKLTPSNLKRLSDKLKRLPLTSQEETFKATVDIIFEKAVDESKYSQTYANLCKELSTLQMVSTTSSILTFRSLLLNKCQKEFENESSNADLVEECKEKKKAGELTEELEEKLKKAKCRSVGNIKFISELFKFGLLNIKIIHFCIKNLLEDENDEENLECLCRLLTNVGKEIDFENEDKIKMNRYFDCLSEICKNIKVRNARIGFMIQDVIELRQKNWIPRQLDSVPKTIDQIHTEYEAENVTKTNVNNREVSNKNSLRYQSVSMDAKQFSNKKYLKAPKLTSKSISGVKECVSSPQKVSFQPSYKSVNKTNQANITSQSVDKIDKSSCNSSDVRNNSSTMYTHMTAQQNVEKRINCPKNCEKLNNELTDKNKKSSKQYTKDEVDRKSNLLIEEYLINNNLKEAIMDFEDFNPVNTEQLHDFLRNIAQSVLERSEIARTQTGRLFYYILKEKKVEVGAFVAALKPIFEAAEDTSIDVPKISEYLGELMAPLINPDFDISFLRDICDPIMNSDLRSTFVSHMLHKASDRLGYAEVLKSINCSKLNLNDNFIEIENLQKHLKDKQVNLITKETKAPQKPALVAETHETILYDILKDPKIGNEEIFVKIKNNFSDEELKSSQFVRGITSAVCRSCLVDAKIDQELFRSRAQLLCKYIEHEEDLELETLFAIQALDHKLQHLPGFIRVIFDMLYDEDVISEEIFFKWRSTSSEDGHAISVLSLKPFFEWLNEEIS